MRILLRTGFALFLAVVAFCGFGLFQFNRQPVDVELLKTIPLGTSEAEIVEKFGTPSGKYKDGRQWAYSGFLGWSIVYINFDENGRFTNFVYDY